MKKERISIRFDERTVMLLHELCEMHGVNISVVVRSMVTRTLDEMMDADGNWIDARGQEGEGEPQGYEGSI